MAPNNGILRQALIEIAISAFLIGAIIKYFLPNQSLIITGIISLLLVIVISRCLDKKNIQFRRIFDYLIWNRLK
jgi:hypothetical protein